MQKYKVGGYFWTQSQIALVMGVTRAAVYNRIVVRGQRPQEFFKPGRTKPPVIETVPRRVPLSAEAFEKQLAKRRLSTQRQRERNRQTAMANGWNIE